MNIEAIDFLNQLNEYGKIDYADYAHLHDLLTSEEPQDEPSDALRRVEKRLAAYATYGPAERVFDWRDVSAVAAALRAAGVGGVR